MAAINSFGGWVGEGGDFEASFQALNKAGGTRANKKLPPAAAAPSIPARIGSSPPISQTGSGAISGFVLKGAKTVTSSDGVFTISYPQSVETTVAGVTLVIPAITKTP